MGTEDSAQRGPRVLNNGKGQETARVSKKKCYPGRRQMGGGGNGEKKKGSEKNSRVKADLVTAWATRESTPRETNLFVPKKEKKKSQRDRESEGGKKYRG